jgi:mRNA interferase MazF
MMIARFAVYLVSLDPTVRSEIAKMRKCVVVSPDEMNRNLRTVIVAPMTTKRRGYPTRVVSRLSGKTGEVALDQMRAIDQTRLVKRLGNLEPAVAANVTRTLQEMFA